MSRATTDAWYNSERIDRLKLVAAYLFLNAAVVLLSLVAMAVQAIRGDEHVTMGEVALGFGVTVAFLFIWFYSAWLLWNARKAGAYWVILLTVRSLLRWIANPINVIALILDLIPAILIAMSWSALKTERLTSIRPKRSPQIGERH